MKKITVAWFLSLLILTSVWVMVEPGLFTTTQFILLRSLLLQYSGILAMGWMSLVMILAARPTFLESWFGGLDKMYRFHKWLGISVAVLSVLHWILSNSRKWAVSLGLLDKSVRAPRPEPVNQLAKWFADHRGWAESVGEWMFYGALMLVAIALIKRIPYRSFYKVHRIFAVIYLGLVFHAIVLTKFSYWLSPVGLVMLPLLVGGVVAAFLSLFKKIGVYHQAHGKIEHIEYYPGVKALEIVIKDLQGWSGHQPGQFAFVTFDKSEGEHPFTIASAWKKGEPKITFIVKELGDYTRGLKESLQVGQEMRVEGPYGRFTFNDDRQTQIWIGGGIGITPFIARMKYLASNKSALNQEIYLFQASAQSDERAFEKLKADAQAAGVQLHFYVNAEGDRLSGEKIREVVQNWKDSSFWFCGPVGLGTALKDDFAAIGENIEDRFHQELFDMR